MGEYVENVDAFNHYLESIKPQNALLRAIRDAWAYIKNLFKGAETKRINDMLEAIDALIDAGASAIKKAQDTERLGESNAVQGEERHSIIGEQGASALDRAEEATTRLDNLAVAREMETAGKDAKTIRMATGWERGADGLWRYEIMDAEVNLYDGDENTIRKKIEVAEEEEKDFMQQSKADTKELRERTNTYLAQMREKYGVAEGEETDVMTDEEIAQLQSLTNKEIEFEDYKERRRKELYNRRMALEAQLGYVSVKNTDDSAMILSTRLGHILQGNDAEVLFVAHPSLRDIEVQFVTDIRDGAFAAYATKGGYKRIELNAKKTPVDMLAPYILHEVQHAIQDIEGFAGGGNLSSLESDEDVTAKEAYDYYHKIAGEVEARNVSARINMTPEERRATLLSETEDVAREDQIFLREGAEMAMAEGMRLPKEEYAKLSSTIMTRQHTYGRPSFDYAFTDGGFYAYDYLGDGVSIVNFAMPIVGNEEIIDVIYKAIDNGTINSSGSLDTFIEEIQSGKRGYPRNIIDAIKKRRRNKGLYIYGSRGQIDNSRRVPAFGKGSRGSIATRGESGNSNESGDQELTTRFSLITPEMDAFYLDAVERGDMATAQKMVMEAAKLAMPNTKVVDEDGNPKVVYHQTNASVYINRETGQNWDELDWRERMEWDERDDWDDYWDEREFNTFSRVNARTTQELDGFFFAPEYDEYTADTYGYYSPDDDIILLNGGMLITSGDAHRSTMHEYAHSITKKYLGEKLAEVTASIPKEDISKASNELLGKAYDKEVPQMIIDEFVSYLVESLSMAETIAIFEGDLGVDEYIETLRNEINSKNTNSKDVLFAVLPLVKENLLLQKEQYGREKENTIVLPRYEYHRLSTDAKKEGGTLWRTEAQHRPNKAGYGVYEVGRGGESTQKEEVTPRHSIHSADSYATGAHITEETIRAYMKRGHQVTKANIRKKYKAYRDVVCQEYSGLGLRLCSEASSSRELKNSKGTIWKRQRTYNRHPKSRLSKKFYSQPSIASIAR